MTSANNAWVRNRPQDHQEQAQIAGQSVAMSRGGLKAAQCINMATFNVTLTVYHKGQVSYAIGLIKCTKLIV